MLETFTSIESLEKNADRDFNRENIFKFVMKSFLSLVKHSYFKTMQCFLESRIPEYAYESETTSPHNEVSRVALDMMNRPLNLLNSVDSEEVRRLVISYFISEILFDDIDGTTKNFIIPSMAINPQFPYVHFLRTIHSALGQSTSLTPIEKRLAADVKKNTYSVFLLYAVIKLSIQNFEAISEQNCADEYFLILGRLLDSAVTKGNFKEEFNASNTEDTSDSDSDFEEEMDVDEDPTTIRENSVLHQAVNLLNEGEQPEKFIKLIERILCGKNTVQSFCMIIYNMIILQRSSPVENRIIGQIAHKPEVLRTLWYNLLTANTKDERLCISSLSKGMVLASNERDRIVPIIVTFCTLFSKLLTTLHDGEFFYCHFNVNETQASFTCESNVEPIENQVMPFNRTEMIHMCLTLREMCVGIVELVYPESRTAWRIMNGERERDVEVIDDRVIWSQLLKNCVVLLRQLHARDLRCNFCPKNHWIAQNLNLPLDRPNDLQIPTWSRRPIRSFQPVRDFTRKNKEDEPPLSTKQLRSITILREIPFVVPFNKRFEVLQGLIATEKLRCQGDMQGFQQGPQTHLNVRRTHLYEDSFDKLSPENEPNLRTKFRIQMINKHQLEEAGIDGGGIFREFLTELLHEAFDPHRGFFVHTKDNMLYPNPCASMLHQNYLKHYYFIGRMLGKAIFENLLIELPLAEFFLSRLAGRNTDIEIDVHLLASLDPDMHKNLMKLKNYDENDFKNLGLDFTVVCDFLGETKVVELKPDGANIPVNSSNWIEYVSAMTDFKLNRQIKQQCNAFRQGLSNVLPISWLYMFDTKEMQTLISGAEVPIDVDDLMKNTKYGGEYSQTHKTVVTFWKVVREFDDNQKRQLLRFGELIVLFYLQFKCNVPTLILQLHHAHVHHFWALKTWIHHSVFRQQAMILIDW